MSIVIIGTGFSGLAMAIKLKSAGIQDFTLLERGNDVGGTWRDNTYPGCACDVQSHVYSFSFEPNPSWGRMFATQPEILAYLRKCADKYGIRSHIRFNENVTEARFDEAAAEWVVKTARGNIHRAKVLVSGAGALSNPAYPKLPGIERFQGKAFHSAEWDHSYELEGKRVAVIGTGASAIQFVPQVASKVAHLDLYQRTPPWVVPKPDRPISNLEKSVFRWLPAAQKLMRGALYSMLESRVLAFAVNPNIMKLGERLARSHIEKQIKDPELRRKVTPDYRLGCKRVLLSDDYYPALALPQVDVITDAVREVREHSIVTADGVERPVDAIIYGTGFRVQEFVPHGLFLGRGGQDLADTFAKGPEAYKGTAIAGFPNLFMLLGPNTGLGHNSVVYMVESQVTYVLDAIRRMRDDGIATLEVSRGAQAEYNKALQDKLGRAVWQSGCKSWYLDESGKNTALWPGFTFKFRHDTAHFDPEAYVVEREGTSSSLPSIENASRPSAETKREVA
jgi:cation diffusion facilitator CzcD-associated flavoprotein CzcO